MALCSDPSVTYLNRFGYNVVRLPRAGIEPMDILGLDTALERLGRLSSVWRTEAREPPSGSPKPVADVDGQKSQNLDLSVGLKVLAGALAGLDAVVPTLDFAYKHARKVQFTFTHVTSTSVEPLEIGNYLASGDLNTGNPVAARYFLDQDRQSFVIADVLKSDIVAVTATDSKGQEVAVDIPAIQSAVGAKVGVKLGPEGGATTTFKGETPITFGFKAFAIAYADGRWQLRGAKPSGNLAFALAPDDADDTEAVLFSRGGLVRI